MHCFEGCLKSLEENTETHEKRKKWALKIKIILGYNLEPCKRSLSGLFHAFIALKKKEKKKKEGKC